MSVRKGESPDYLSAFNTLESATFIVFFPAFLLGPLSSVYPELSPQAQAHIILPVSFVPQYNTYKKSKGVIVSGASAGKEKKKKLIIYF